MTEVLSKSVIDLSSEASPDEAFFKIEKLFESHVFNNSAVQLDLGENVFDAEHLGRLKQLSEVNSIRIDSFIIRDEEAKAPMEALEFTVIVKENAQPTEDVVSESNEEAVNQPSEEPEESDDDVVEEIKITELTEESYIELEKDESEEMFPVESSDGVKIANSKEVKTLFINQTLRSGQYVSYDGNVVVVGDTHPGSEIIATGDIIVWGTLSGLAHAGSPWNIDASVRALKINAIQLRIANCIARRPDMPNRITHELPLKPECAVVLNGDIRILSYK